MGMYEKMITCSDEPITNCTLPAQHLTTERRVIGLYYKPLTDQHHRRLCEVELSGQSC